MNKIKSLPQKKSRLLLIFLLPLILTQSLLIFLFYDRHWEKIITRFCNIARNQIDFLKIRRMVTSSTKFCNKVFF